MPPLDHPKYEAFALGIASGKPQRDAYVEAGYKWHEGNASRLRSNEKVGARIAEILTERSRAVQENTGYKAIQLFRDIEKVFKLAMDKELPIEALKAVELAARCLGYSESPTLTHEHLNGEAIPVARGPEPEHPNSLGNVLRFGRVQEHVKKQIARRQ